MINNFAELQNVFFKLKNPSFLNNFGCLSKQNLSPHLVHGKIGLVNYTGMFTQLQNFYTHWIRVLKTTKTTHSTVLFFAILIMKF